MFQFSLKNGARASSAGRVGGASCLFVGAKNVGVRGRMWRWEWLGLPTPTAPGACWHPWAAGGYGHGASPNPRGRLRSPLTLAAPPLPHSRLCMEGRGLRAGKKRGHERIWQVFWLANLTKGAFSRVFAALPTLGWGGIAQWLLPCGVARMSRLAWRGGPLAHSSGTVRDSHSVPF